MYSVPRHKDRSWNGYGVASLGLANGAFVTAPFLLLIPVAVRRPRRHISDAGPINEEQGR